LNNNFPLLRSDAGHILGVRASEVILGEFESKLCEIKGTGSAILKLYFGTGPVQCHSNTAFYTYIERYSLTDWALLYFI
jgi:hypothetical protein